MADCINSKYRIARKDYQCDACIWLDNEGLPDLTYSEAKKWIIAQREHCKIKKGQRYLCETVKDERFIYIFRARPEINEICIKYNVYLQ